MINVDLRIINLSCTGLSNISLLAYYNELLELEITVKVCFECTVRFFLKSFKDDFCTIILTSI